MEVKVYLTQSNEIVEVDEATGELIDSFIETESIYDTDPLTCNFGLANPNYKMTQVEFCNAVLGILPEPETGGETGGSGTGSDTESGTGGQNSGSGDTSTDGSGSTGGGANN